MIPLNKTSMKYFKQIAIFLINFFVSYYFVSCTPCHEKQEEVRKYNKDTTLMYRWVRTYMMPDSTYDIYEYRPNGDVYGGKAKKNSLMNITLRKRSETWYSDMGNCYFSSCAQGNLETSLAYSYQIINDTLIEDNARKYYKLFKSK